MPALPHVLFIITDQQRYDSIGALGCPWMKTPRLDRLAAGGAVLERCYAAAPSCVPSRYSLFNAKYPRAGGVYSNENAWSQTWADHLARAGYCCVNIGKMHTQPMDAPAGFHQRFVVENKDRPDLDPKTLFWDQWDRHLLASGQPKPGRYSYPRDPGYGTALGAFAWPLADQYHSDEFTGNLAVSYIEQYRSDAPLFLEVGFPGPHPPYDPPQRYLDQYADTAIPLPDFTEAERALQPPCHETCRREMTVGNHDAVKWLDPPAPAQLLRLRRHYAANMTLIDEKVGHILEALERRGMAENCLVIFTSDHGDCLGDHGLVQKWNMYEETVRVPAILHAPGRVPAGLRHTALAQQMDLAHWLFGELGLDIPADWETEPLRLDAAGGDGGRQRVFAEQGRDNVWYGAAYQAMIRNRTHKLVWYPGEAWGEVYDLSADPGEKRNLWGTPAYAAVQRELLDEITKFKAGSK